MVDRSADDTYTNSSKSNSTSASIDRFSTLMRDKPHSRKVQTQSCEAIWKYAVKKKNSGINFASSGVISLIFSAMMNFPKDEKLQEMACGAMGQISFCNSHDRYAIANNGAIPLITKAMKNHPNKASVQKRACSLLGNLACDNRSARTSIHANDGIVLIHQMMDIHATDIPLQEKAFYALGNICKKNNAIIHTITDNGGLNLISTAIKDNSLNKSLLAQALGVLGKLAFDNECKLAIAEGETIQLIADAVQNHQSDINIIRKCLVLLCCLSRKEVGQMSKLVEIPHTGDESHHHFEFQNTQEDQQRSDFNCTSSSVNDNSITPCGISCKLHKILEAMVDTGVIRSLPGIMLIHPDDSQIQESACYLIRNLSFDDCSLNSLKGTFSAQFLKSMGKKSVSNMKYMSEALENLDDDAYSMSLSTINSMI